MKAWIIEKHGGSEVLQYREVSTPEPKTDEARIRVKAVGLNHLDVWVRKGVAGHAFPLPIIPGCDVSGVVESLGDLSAMEKKSLEKRGIEVGSSVLVNPTLSCGQCEMCKNDFPPLCRQFGMIGETCNGGCAEFLVAPARNLVLLPRSLTFEEAASLPIASVTAWSMLHRKAGLRSGHLILIQAGGSGVSIAAIQMAKILGAKVITTVSTPEKMKRAKELGADYVIDYKKTPFREEVKKICKSLGRRGVDVVIDHVGESTFAESIKCLDWGGKIVTCGATSGAEVMLDLKPIFFKNLSILGSTMGSFSDLTDVLAMVDTGRYKPMIDFIFPIQELPHALELLEQRKNFGKIVLKQD